MLVLEFTALCYNNNTNVNGLMCSELPAQSNQEGDDDDDEVCVGGVWEKEGRICESVRINYSD